MAKGKVLVVDDSPMNLQMITAPLKASGYSVLTAVDGPSAIDVAEREQPSVIVLDIVLPGKNGYQVCRHLKMQPATKDSKVILLSSKNQEADKFWGMKQGADLYMTKPFEEEELLANVEKFMQ